MTPEDFLAISGALAWLWAGWRLFIVTRIVRQRLHALPRRLRWAFCGPLDNDDGVPAAARSVRIVPAYEARKILTPSGLELRRSRIGRYELM